MSLSSDVSVGSVRVVVVDPGNMTRYVLVLSQLPLEACHIFGCDKGSFLVAVPNLRTRTMFFSPRDGATANYVCEKLDVSWGDAEQIASVLNTLSLNRSDKDLDRSELLAAIEDVLNIARSSADPQIIYDRVFELHANRVRPVLDRMGISFDWYDSYTSYKYTEDVAAYVRALTDLSVRLG